MLNESSTRDEERDFICAECNVRRLNNVLLVLLDLWNLGDETLRITGVN